MGSIPRHTHRSCGVGERDGEGPQVGPDSTTTSSLLTLAEPDDPFDGVGVDDEVLAPRSGHGRTPRRAAISRTAPAPKWVTPSLAWVNPCDRPLGHPLPSASAGTACMATHMLDSDYVLDLTTCWT